MENENVNEGGLVAKFNKTVNYLEMQSTKRLVIIATLVFFGLIVIRSIVAAVFYSILPMMF